VLLALRAAEVLVSSAILRGELAALGPAPPRHLQPDLVRDAAEIAGLVAVIPLPVAVACGRHPSACGRGLWPWIKWMGLWPSSRSEIKWMGLWPCSRSRTRNNDDSAAPHGFSPALPRRSAAGSESSPGTIFQAASSLEDASPARPGIVASRRLIMASRRWSSHGTSR
jgi:hypothetical protein